jgi:hypothetical protein
MTTDGRDQLNWVMDPELVEFLWTETREVFGTKLWFESVLDWEGIPERWQDELVRRSGQSIVDVLIEAVGDLREPDPSLVFLGLHETCARYQIILEIPPHPQRGDLLQRARALRDAGLTRPAYARQTWALESESVVALGRAIEAARKDTRPEIRARRIADVLADCLGDERADELSLRCGEELSIAVYIAIKPLSADAEMSLILSAIRDFFRDPHHGDIVLEFAPRPGQ